MSFKVDKVFGQEGLIASYLKGYEYRAGQIKMAEAVMRAFEEKKHLIVEAGTGTGKTLAYLVPAIAAALGKRAACHHFDRHQKFAGAIDGKGHTFSAANRAEKVLRRIYERQGQLRLPLPRQKSGDHADTRRRRRDRPFQGGPRMGRRDQRPATAPNSYLPENLPFWNRVIARREICIGQKCPDFEPCFITRAGRGPRKPIS